MRILKKIICTVLTVTYAVCMLTATAYADTDDPDTVPSDSETVYSDRRSIELPTCEKEGYSFLGWNTSEDGNGVYFLPGYVLNLSDGDCISLFGIWRELPEVEEDPVGTELPLGNEPETVQTEDAQIDGDEEPDMPEDLDAEPEHEAVPEIVSDVPAQYTFSVFTGHMNHVFLTDPTGSMLWNDPSCTIQEALSEGSGYVLYLHPEDGYELPDRFSFRFLGRNDRGELAAVSEPVFVSVYGTETADENTAFDFSYTSHDGDEQKTQLYVALTEPAVEELFLWNSLTSRLEILAAAAPEFEAIEIIADGVPVISFEAVPDGINSQEDEEISWDGSGEEATEFEFMAVSLQETFAEGEESA